MDTITRTGLAFCIAALTAISSLTASVPQLINAQGKLTDGTGNPLPTNNYSITFTIYSAVSGGDVKWTETNPSVAISNGQFNVLLGSINPISDTVFGGSIRYLGIKVGSDPEMTPRSRLVSVGYAHRVSTIDGAIGGTITGDTKIKSGELRVAADTGEAVIRIGDVKPGGSYVNLAMSNTVNGYAQIQSIKSEGANWGVLSLNARGGNVGIGTLSPTANFHFVGDQAFFVGKASNGWATMDVDNTGNGPIAVFRGNGGVGIGTTSPETKFHFVGNQAFFVGTATNGFAALDVKNTGNGPIALFRGNGNVGIGTTTPSSTLDVRGTTSTCVLEITGGCDLAEPIETSGSIDLQVGSVVVIDDENPGMLKLSQTAYDTRVAGVISGAGGIKPGLTLRQEGNLDQGQNIALSGRVYVLATASNGPIKPGDRLTSSGIPGCAMKVTDSSRADGAVLGKAMSGLESGEGLVLVLVNLQ